MAEIVVASTRAHRAGALKGGVDLVSDIGGGAVTQADPAAIRRAVDNVVVNALAATPAGGTVTVTVRRSSEEASIAVVDTDRGFPRSS